MNTTATTTILTAVEKATLQAIINSEYYEGRGSHVWADCLTDMNHSDKQLFGCLPRLEEKGLVQICEYDENENTVGLTEAGYEALDM